MKFLLLFFSLSVYAQNIENGKKIYNKCAACHGATALGNSHAPRLASQWSWYTEKQLRDIKNGKRKVPSMTPYVTPLTEENIKDVAKFLQELK